MGDALVAAFFAEEKPKAREKRRAKVESWLGGLPVAWDKLAVIAATSKQGIFLDETTEDDYTYQGRLFWPSDFRDEVLARLLALNAERHAEEIRLGIAPGMKERVEEQDY